MEIAKKKRCNSCGGFCGGSGRRGGCKFAANEAKRRADEIWRYASGSAPTTTAAQAATDKSLTRCASARDGDCTHPQCPQLRDNEPRATGRHCPLDISSDED